MEEFDRRYNDSHLQFIVERITDIKSDITELKDSTKEMAAAINRLVVVETKQDAMNQSYEKIATQLESEIKKRETLEARVETLEKEQPDMERVKDWFYKGILAILTVVGIFILKFVGLY